MTHIFEESIVQRSSDFNSYVVGHPILINTSNDLLQSIFYPSGFPIVFVIGPTGVGKTTLIHRLIKRIIKDELKNLENNPGTIPVLVVDALANDSGNFDWKDFYYRALQALQEPLIESKIDFKETTIINGLAQTKKINDRGALRRAFEKALYYRSPRAVFIDEAQHLTKMSSGRKLKDQIDTIKSLVNTTNVLPILIGTYELLPLLNLSGQLSRRSAVIHFPRYKLKTKEDIKDFQSILLTFQRKLPLKKEPELINYWEFLYERSVGCVGILKDWLSRSLIIALSNGEDTITLSNLKKQALSIKQCEKILSEIFEGENEMEDNNNNQRLLTLLGLENLKADNDKKKNKSRRIGQRNPVRDPVGPGNIFLDS